jgi:hypothetical protein
LSLEEVDGDVAQFSQPTVQVMIHKRTRAGERLRVNAER